ncbi:MAG: 3-deoxy-D-manno-octulosonic acid transferase [Wenzhouxiangella sp.]
MRSFYRLLTLLLTPLALLRLQRGESRAGRWRERLGQIKALPPGQVWVHAASVGEINAAQGLIAALLERGEAVLVSTMTATGAERCRVLFADRVEHRYLALDNPLAVRAWLARARPRVGLIMETEIWPELFGRCRALNIPLLLISARLGDQAMTRYQRFSGLYGQALAAVSMAACQSSADAERLAALGLPEQCLQVTGNLKFDVPVAAGLASGSRSLKTAVADRPVWTAGSTRPGEEEILIAAHRELLRTHPAALLILAPRHPERAANIAGLLEAARLRWCRFDRMPAADTQVVLVDRLGVLLQCYALAQIAFVGGSLVAVGGHNLLEPASLGLPVLAGPHLQQQAEAARLLSASGGLIRLADAASLTECLKRLIDNPGAAERIGQAANAALAEGRGSLARTLAAIAPWLAPSGPEQPAPSAATG